METLDKKQLGNRIRRLRLDAGYKQESVASVLGYSRSSYSFKEEGKTWFQINDLILLSDLFQVPLEHFFLPEATTPSGRVRRSRNKTHPLP